MRIEKKPIETLKQQKDSFLNYIKTKEKYSWIIADLFEDDEIEKIDNMKWIKEHLEQKWISKEQTDSLETEYKSHLKRQRKWTSTEKTDSSESDKSDLKWESFYWPIDDWPDEIKKSVEENDKILENIKKDILKDYEFVSLDIKNFVDTEFWIGNNRNPKEIKCEGVTNVEHIEYDIAKIKWEIHDINFKKKIKENEIENLKDDIVIKKNKLWQAKFFDFKEKKNLKEKIDKKRADKEKIEKEINKKEEELKGKYERLKKYTETKKLIDKVLKRKDMKERDISQNYDRSNLESTKESIWTIKKNMSDCIEYLSKDTLNNIKEIIIKIINKTISEQKQALCEKIGEYFSYFYCGEKRYDIIFHNDGRDNTWQFYTHFYSHIPTIYSKTKIDPEISHIINQLWWDIDSIDKKAIDQAFINDVFIHTTWFNALNDILEEWWLISTNELKKKGKKTTQKTTNHKDIYFSRWDKINSYWDHECNEDYMYIANTMSSFANNWYWVPLNRDMQPNSPYKDSGDHDTDWYSIISKSSIGKSWNTETYSKINLEDIYIFVSETKKEEIEKNPKYKTKGANIIYIPKNLSGKMDYELYEFIEKEITARNKLKTNRTPIPKKIITNEDGIDSINNSYKRAFCEPIWKKFEKISNPLKGADYETIIKFLIKISEDFGFKNLEEYKTRNIEENLRNFITKNELIKANKYPIELTILAIILTKIWLWNIKQGRVWLWKIKEGKMWDKLREYWYKYKEIWILESIINFIFYIKNEWTWEYTKENWRKRIKSLWQDLWVEYNIIKEYIIGIVEVTAQKDEIKIIKDI